MSNPRDEFWMSHALTLAEKAAKAGEVPVGAVLVHQDQLIAQGYNQPITQLDPTAHAEVVVLREGAKKLGNYRLPECTLYVTLEPCAMCAGAMVHARIQRLVYGAKDPRTGVVSTQLNLLDQSFLNHRVIHEGGVLSSACGAILSAFFKAKR